MCNNSVSYVVKDICENKKVKPIRSKYPPEKVFVGFVKKKKGKKHKGRKKRKKKSSCGCNSGGL